MSKNKHKPGEVAPCYVYLICSQVDGKLHGPCKVGISDKPEKRLRQVQTGSPHKLIVAFAFLFWDRRMASLVETAFHDCHDESRMQGEWFNMLPHEALRGLVDVVKIGLDRIVENDEGRELDLDSLMNLTGLMKAAKLLYHIYEARGELRGSLNKELLN